MNIDASKLNEVYLNHGIPKVATDERFYRVPGASDYALSDYGRLYNRVTNRKAKYTYINDPWHTGEGYYIRFDNETEEKPVSIEELISRVFFDGQKMHFRTFGYHGSLKHRWKVENLHIILNRKQLIEYMQAIFHHRKPRYPKKYQGNTFVNRMDLTRGQAKQTYGSAKQRATSKRVKAEKPHYRETTMEQALIDDPQLFYSWLLDHQYYYPERLELDKDILTFGEKDIYSRDTMCLVPRYINDFFRPTASQLGYGIRKIEKNGEIYFHVPTRKGELPIRCETYSDALTVGRRIKADKIRSMIERERKLGYMPKYILNTIKKWATRCEKGQIKIWEPSAETKRRYINGK